VPLPVPDLRNEIGQGHGTFGYIARVMDPHVELLRKLFLTHPAWLAAARYIKDGSSSSVRFSHVPGAYHLLRKEGQSLLLDGPASAPDFAFRFTPRAIERLSAVQGSDIGDFGVELLECVGANDPDTQVRLRVVAGFSKLLRGGYVNLLLKGGQRVLAHGGKGASLSDVRKLVTQLRSDDGSWEHD
jgi:hypothetical protein